MRRSLTFKWIATLLLSSLTGVLLVGLFAYRTTLAEYDRFRTEQARSTFMNQLIAYYQTRGSWDGLDRWLQRDGPPPNEPRPGPPRFFALADANGVIVLGNGPLHEGDKATEAQLDQGIPVQVDGKQVGTVLTGGPTPGLDSREQNFITRTNQALFGGALGASLIAVFIGLVLSRQFLRPLSELRDAIVAMKQGNLNQRVQVRTQDELGDLAETFNQMSAQIHKANQLRQQMTADIAHDLRTPLLVISGYLEAMVDGTLQGTIARFQTMYQQANILKRLIEDLRTLSLADAGELKLLCQPVKPAELLHQVRQSFEPLAEQQGVKLIMQASESLPLVQIDSERMAQVLGNVVSNALRYTPEGGTVTLSATSQQDSIQLAVHDTGTGIAPDKLPYIFERFYRTDESRHRQSGESGLGLAIAKSIVESHGGTISATSEVGQGTTILVDLPLYSKDHPAPKAAAR